MRIGRAFKNWLGRRGGFWWCARCRDTWNWKEAHVTDFEFDRGCFPLCEECWSELTPDQRLPYYDALVTEWIRQLPSRADEYLATQVKIRKAVEAGL